MLSTADTTFDEAASFEQPDTAGLELSNDERALIYTTDTRPQVPEGVSMLICAVIMAAMQQTRDQKEGYRDVPTDPESGEPLCISWDILSTEQRKRSIHKVHVPIRPTKIPKRFPDVPTSRRTDTTPDIN